MTQRLKRFCALCVTALLFLSASATGYPYENLAVGGTPSYAGAAWHTGATKVSAYFDNDVSTCMGFQSVKKDGSFHIQYDFNEAKVVNAYGIQCAKSTYYNATKRAPKTFSFEGYDADNGVWVSLHTRTSESSWKNEELRVYKFSNSTAYTKYRFVETAWDENSTYCGFAELQFYYIDTSDTLLVESDAENFGTPNPAYGEHTGMTVGEEVTCTIEGADAIQDGAQGGKFSFVGYEVWGKADTATPELIDEGTETNVTYMQSSYTKLIWKWGMAPIRVATDGNDGNDGYSAPMATISAAVAAAKVAGQSISVEAGEYAISAALTIEKDVRIYANGGEVIVRGAGSHKLLTLNHASASVEGITFVNGKATGSRDYTGSSRIASGVEVTAGTLRNCIVTGCDSDGYGTPALLAKGENALVKGCTISNNTARCTDSNKRYYALHGGGLGITLGTVEDCLIAGNRGGSATGVWQSGGTVRNCTISGNIGSHEQTGETSTLGTEACAWDTVFMKGGTMTGCTITRNVAASAAGAYLIGTAKMSGCTVSFNRATMDRPMTVAASDMMTSEHQPTDISHRQPFGGVILGSVNAAVENCLIATNFADTCGYDQGLHVIAGTATGNTFDANGEDANTSKSTSSVAYVVPDDGETGTWPYDTEAKAARSIQAAVDAVAASRENPGTVFLAAGTYLPPEGVKRFVTLKRPVRIVGPADGSAILSGSSRQGVRGFWIAHDFAEISHLTFLGFSSAAGDGMDEAGKGCYVAGALYAGKVSECGVSGCAQYNYTSPTALWMFGGTLTQSEVSGCFTTGSGGENQRGGGVQTYGGVIEDCLISDNRASYGGGVFVAGSAAVIRRTRIVGNEASGYNTVLKHPGAGVFMNAGGRVESCLITGNYGNATAAGYTGAGIYMSAGTVANCTVAGNTHKTAGLVGGVHITGGTLVNSIVWGNTAGGSDSDVTVGGGSVTYTCYSEAENEANNFAENPCFKGRGREPYALRSVSPCTGKGDASIWTADDLDLVGSPRLRGALVDLGAYSVRNPGLRLMVK